MVEVLTGFAVVGLAVAVGYVIARVGFLGEDAAAVLTRLVFNLLAPALMFATLATADVAGLLSSLLPVSATAALGVMAVFAVVSALRWRQDVGRTVVGALSSGYVNSNNIGIPVSLYMLGDAGYSAPVLLFQTVLVAPVALTILDAHSRGRAGPTAILRSALSTPIVVASLLGLLSAATGVRPPDILLTALGLLGQPAVPLILIAFGMSLAGQRVLEPGGDRRAVFLAGVLKLVVMPVTAYLVGRFAFALEGHGLYAVTVLAALPTAQNVFVYADQYRTAPTQARDTIFLTTIGAIPVLLVTAVVLG